MKLSRNILEQDSYDNQLGNLVKKCCMAGYRLTSLYLYCYILRALLPLQIEFTDSMFVCDKTLVYTNKFSREKCCL